MTELDKHFHIDFEPQAHQEAIITENNCRFMVLTPQLIRVEYDPDHEFEDRPTQLIWYRQQPVPEFKVKKTEGKIEIETDYLLLTYTPDKIDTGFSRDNLKIKLKKLANTWHYGDDNQGNLPGTIRTLDETAGDIELEDSLMSREGWAVVDDSQTLVFNENYWLETRDKKEEYQDLYFFGYGHQYKKCLQDFCKVAGEVPLLPRWSLGNWWSRYWEYTEEELKNLMKEFTEKEIPLSVCIIDMDWHVVDNEYTNGWTGFTWNKDLFPEPGKFIDWLHQQQLKTALNLHPHDGVHAHEKQYEEIVEFMDIDPATEKPVEFDISDSEFIKAYFEFLIKPLEEDDVDFWWMDWQQGEQTKMEGLDPLWALNHLHFYDRVKNGDKRPFVFSRWAGLSNHRYPIGFSGDSIVCWDSLKIQPYLTAAAANVCFGWWSHDVGGHYFGQEDSELYLRWVQFGLFSPIFRLHCTKDPYLERRPWGHNEEVFKHTQQAMQLRHALIPYLYTMSWRNYQESIPLITPMYYDYPETEAAYIVSDQYFYGSELLVTPFVTPRDEETNLSKQQVWLPEGDWFNFFDGEYYKGDNWHALYGGLDRIPAFARAGAIIPLAGNVLKQGVTNPRQFEVNIFPGADNTFELYEDDGESLAYEQGNYAITKFSQKWQQNKLTFEIGQVTGDKTQVPDAREYTLVFRGIKNPDQIELSINGQLQSLESSYNSDNDSLKIKIDKITPDNQVTVILTIDKASLISRKDRTLTRCKQMLRTFRMPSWAKSQIEEGIIANLDGNNLDFLRNFSSVLTKSQMQALIEILAGVGLSRIEDDRQDKVIVWNNQGEKGITYQVSAWTMMDNFAEHEEVTDCKIIDLKEIEDYESEIKVNMFDLVQLEI